MIWLRDFKLFVDEILLNNSRNFKLEVLNKYKDNESVKYFLNIIYNPYIVFGISDKKLKRDVGFQQGTFWLDYPQDDCVFEYLKEHNTGTDIDIWTVQKYRQNNVTEDCRDLFDKIVTKNLQLGVEVKSINKIIPNLIPTFNVQLANKYFDDPTKVNGKSFTLTTKIDGGRIIAIKKNGIAKFYTRQGQEYDGLVDLKEEMETYMPDNICLDGEITLLDKGNLISKDQYKQTMKITRADGEKHGVKMIVFDIMTAEEFEKQECNTIYEDRKAKLAYMFKGLDHHPYKYFTKITEWYTGEDTSVIIPMLNEAIANGEEGLMININDAPYYFKRCDTLLKVKKMQDIDLEIIGYYEGNNGNEGKLGGFICDYKGNELRVGGGYSKEFREEAWKHPEDYIGLTMTVQYFEETVNQGGGTSLRFPVFLDLRYDK